MSEDIQKPVGSAGLHLSESIREVNLEVIHIEIDPPLPSMGSFPDSLELIKSLLPFPP